MGGREGGKCPVWCACFVAFAKKKKNGPLWPCNRSLCFIYGARDRKEKTKNTTTTTIAVFGDPQTAPSPLTSWTTCTDANARKFKTVSSSHTIDARSPTRPPTRPPFRTCCNYGTPLPPFPSHIPTNTRRRAAARAPREGGPGAWRSTREDPGTSSPARARGCSRSGSSLPPGRARALPASD